LINVNSLNEEQRNDYIFGNQIGPITNRFGWLEGALMGDIQTIVNTNQNGRHLVVGGGNLSIPILVCTALELTSALYTCNTKYLGGYNAEDNVKIFISDIFPDRVRWIPRIIWDGVRNGVDHLFIPKTIQYHQTTIKFAFYVEGESAVTRNNDLVVIMINSLELFHTLEHAIQIYREKLQNNIAFQRKFIIAWDSIESHIFIKPTETQKINEIQYLLTQLGQSNPFRLFQKCIRLGDLISSSSAIPAACSLYVL
jgi:hypothetical protein